MSADVNQSAAPELLIVLGKNIGVGSTPEDIRHKPRHLSQESRMNVLAAGELWTPDTDLLFSSGQTAGQGTLSEAGAMKDYLAMRHPEIPEERVFTEERSIDTAGNADEVAKLLAQKEKSYGRVGLVTVGYHLKNAARLFQNYGVQINDKYPAEVVVRTIHPVLNRYVMLWSASDKVAAEYRRERIRAMMLSIDKRGKLLRQITTRNRR